MYGNIIKEWLIRVIVTVIAVTLQERIADMVSAFVDKLVIHRKSTNGQK